MILTEHERISPGCHDILTAVRDALEDTEHGKDLVLGVFRVLLTSGPPRDDDCALMAEVLRSAAGTPTQREWERDHGRMT